MDKIRVLFVDDDMALGNIVTLALESAGYEVHYQTSLAGSQQRTEPEQLRCQAPEVLGRRAHA